MTTGLTFDWDYDEASLKRLQAKVGDQRTRVGRMAKFYAKPTEWFTAWYGGQLAKAMGRHAPEGATRKLKESFSFTWTAPHGGAVTSSADYAMYVQTGTKPHMPPSGALAAWAKYRGVPLWPVLLEIAEHGTKANPYMDRAQNEVRAMLSPGLRVWGAKVQMLWGK